jgi:hypothetical protein
MTAKEMRECMVSFLLHNERMGSMRDKGIKERPPFFFVGTDKLNNKLGGDQTVICLPLWPRLKYASDMEDLLREFDRVFGHYSWVRLRSGLPTYLGRLTLLYGEDSVSRCFPIHGWKELVKGGIEVYVAKGNHHSTSTPP